MAAAANLDDALHALADPSRRSMVERLSRGPASVSELAEPLEMSLPAVVQHLDVLQRSGLVRSEKVGRVRTCRLEPAPMRAVESGSPSTAPIWRAASTGSATSSTTTYGGTDERHPRRIHDRAPLRPDAGADLQRLRRPGAEAAVVRQCRQLGGRRMGARLPRRRRRAQRRRRRRRGSAHGSAAASTTSSRTSESSTATTSSTTA